MSSFVSSTSVKPQCEFCDQLPGDDTVHMSASLHSDYIIYFPEELPEVITIHRDDGSAIRWTTATWRNRYKTACTKSPAARKKSTLMGRLCKSIGEYFAPTTSSANAKADAKATALEANNNAVPTTIIHPNTSALAPASAPTSPTTTINQYSEPIASPVPSLSADSDSDSDWSTASIVISSSSGPSTPRTPGTPVSMFCCDPIIVEASDVADQDQYQRHLSDAPIHASFLSLEVALAGDDSEKPYRPREVVRVIHATSTSLQTVAPFAATKRRGSSDVRTKNHNNNNNHDNNAWTTEPLYTHSHSMYHPAIGFYH